MNLSGGKRSDFHSQVADTITDLQREFSGLKVCNDPVQIRHGMAQRADVLHSYLLSSCRLYSSI